MKKMTETEKAVEELTLMLMYLNRFTDARSYNPDEDLFAWKGYDFDVINALDDKDDIRQGSRRSKSVYITEQGVKKAKALLEKYNIRAIAMANLYGIYDKALLLDVYNDQNGQNMTQAELHKHFREAAFALKRAEIVLRDDEIIKSEIIRNDSYEELMQLKWGKDYYVPDREVLLNYQDDKYIEPSPQYNELRLFLERTVADASPQNIDEITHKVALMCRDGVEIQEIVDYLNGICTLLNSEDKKDFEALLYVLIEIFNAVRIWENNGFKPNELSNRKMGDVFSESALADFAIGGSFNTNQLLVQYGEPVIKLSIQLAGRTVEQLKQIASSIGLKGVSKFRKLQLIELVANELANEKQLGLCELLAELNTLEMTILKKALKRDNVKVDEGFLIFNNKLLRYGYAQIYNFKDKYYFVISDEIKPVIKSIIKTKAFKKQYYMNNVKAPLENIMLLYGVLKLDDAVAIIQMAEPNFTATNTLYCVVEELLKTDGDYEVVGQYIVTGAIRYLLGGLEKYRQKKALYDIVKKLTVHYHKLPLAPLTETDYLYFVYSKKIDQTFALERLESLIRDQANSDFGNDDNLLYEYLFTIDILAKQAIPLDVLHSIIPENVLPITDRQLFNTLYAEHVQQARSWLIKGHNKMSLEALGYSFEKYVPSVKSGTVVRSTKKVGRNDPCPCGSGKKYKKCCLKLN